MAKLRVAIIKTFFFKILNSIVYFCLQMFFFQDEDKNIKNTNHGDAGLHKHFNFAVMLMERRFRMALTI